MAEDSRFESAWGWGRGRVLGPGLGLGSRFGCKGFHDPCKSKPYRKNSREKQYIEQVVYWLCSRLRLSLGRRRCACWDQVLSATQTDYSLQCCSYCTDPLDSRAPTLPVKIAVSPAVGKTPAAEPSIGAKCFSHLPRLLPPSVSLLCARTPPGPESPVLSGSVLAPQCWRCSEQHRSEPRLHRALLSGECGCARLLKRGRRSALVPFACQVRCLLQTLQTIYRSALAKFACGGLRERGGQVLRLNGACRRPRRPNATPSTQPPLVPWLLRLNSLQHA